MSGGVDSSVAAALMVEEYGKENVTGLTLEMFCGSEKAIKDARSVCKKLGIKHRVINIREAFEALVIDEFIKDYSKGKTPIPCVFCNPRVKFSALIAEAKKIGADRVATGHYARVEPLQVKSKKLKVKSVSGDILNTKFYILKRGLDPLKDQSYFLYRLTQPQLSSIVFPLGEMDKTEVRKRAKALGLKTAEKKDSQGICFIHEGTVADWIKEKVGVTPGNIIDTNGKVVGRHEGIVYYTVGQRKRIGGGYDKPMFVVAINSDKNEVVIGGVEGLYQKEIIISDVYWINEPRLPLKCTAKIRYNMNDTKCVVKLQNSNSKEQTNLKIKNLDLNRNSKFEIQNYVVTFKKPQRAVTPGQSVVFYQNNQTLGGGIIAQ